MVDGENISNSGLLEEAKVRALVDANHLGVAAFGTAGEVLYFDDDRYVVRPMEDWDASLNFSARNFWSLVAEYEIPRDSLPKTLFSMPIRALQ